MFAVVQADVILRVTTSCICGSDLHMYMGAMPGMKSGDIVGHEFMGVIEAVGPEVKSVHEGITLPLHQISSFFSPFKH